MKIRHNNYSTRSRVLHQTFPASKTSQVEPSLHELLVAYQKGENIDKYISSAVKASADLQFKNRVGKVDPLTEIPDYIRQVEQEEMSQNVNVEHEYVDTQSQTVETSIKDPAAPAAQSDTVKTE